ncbi:MAG: sigma-54 dependent transcriptional regulator [Eubacteriales bacterium]
MFEDYGINRVIEPKNVLPTSAWRIDNKREIYSNEIRIDIKRLHIETTSFKQICIECNNNEEKIKERIIDIVIKRGKLHNPITDTGGVAFGTVDKIGKDYDNYLSLEHGEEVICNTSLATIPIYISKITHIDFAFSQIEVEGYTIAFNKCKIVRRPPELPINLLLFAFDESGSLLAVSKIAKDKEQFLIVGNNILTNMLFGLAIRNSRGEKANIVCLIDKLSDIKISGKGFDQLISLIFSEIHHVNILRPTECIARLDMGNFFDLTINCADIPGAETINVLATKDSGVVYFANLINNYNIALYITEAVGREIEIKGAEGYIADYEEYDIELIRQIAPYFENSHVISTKTKEIEIGDEEKLEMQNKRFTDNKGFLDDFVYESQAMSLVLNEILSVAKYDCNVLITGDTGVGKEKVASIIHKCSSRKMYPFVKINCAAISEHLMESEFFGYEKGSFTGASQTGKKGYFEVSDNGIILLDEVGDLPLDMQAKLLRVIQDGEFYKVGGTKPIKSNVRIISSTNKNLEELVEEKKFRRDLYYRLNVFPIRVPSLHERKNEIPSLTHFFIQKYNEKFGLKKSISTEAIEYLKECSWTGNIRELENVVQRLLITTNSDIISAYDAMKELHTDLFAKLPEIKLDEIQDNSPINLEKMIENYEREIIEFAFNKYGSSRKAAKAIGISQTQIIRKKSKYNIF